MTKLFLAAAAATAVLFGSVTLSGPVLAKGDEPKETKKCPKGKKCLRDDLTNDEIYYSGYWLARTGQYAAAIEVLDKASVKDERILTYLGFATRKLGNHDAALALYNKALALNPSYAVARSYMGEAFVTKGDLGKAREQLVEIAKLCGTTCAEYSDLAKELTKAGG